MKKTIKFIFLTLSLLSFSGNTDALTLELSNGWNLLSNRTTITAADLFSDDTKFSSAWKWNTDKWAVYIPGETTLGEYAASKGFSELSTINPGEGFWVNSQLSQTVSISGTETVNNTITLLSGWNLKGLTSENFINAGLLFTDSQTVSSIWKWDNDTWAVYIPEETNQGAYAASKGFNELSTLKPGEGFWVNASTDLQVPVYNYIVVDTNQDDCFDTSGNKITCGSSLNGQDAQYTTAASNYTNNGDGTVTDLNTGLIWQRHHSTAVPWADADTYCDDLVLGSEADWRLPSIKELYSLIDFNGYTGGMNDTYDNWTENNWKLYIDGSWDTGDDSAIFIQETGNADTGDRILDGQVWTSTDPVGTTMDNNDSVQGGNFLDGRIKAYPKTDSKFTRCVCGNTAYGENSYTLTDNGDTVTDASTGLVWTKAYSNDTSEFSEVLSIESNGGDAGAMDWENALSFCENLDYAGSKDWRLPDIKELHSITKNPETEGLPAIDTDFFDLAAVELPDYCKGGTFSSYPYFWSSTTHMEYKAPTNTVAYGDKALYVAFGPGWGSMNGGLTWIDAHSPGSQRSDPKTGDPGSSSWACGFGPQGDYISIYNFVRCVRNAKTTTD